MNTNTTPTSHDPYSLQEIALSIELHLNDLWESPYGDADSTVAVSNDPYPGGIDGPHPTRLITLEVDGRNFDIYVVRKGGE